MTRYLVVGGGIVGASIAYRLADAGAETILVDAGRPGRRTTRNTFAWVGAGDPRLHLTPEYKALNIAGMAAYRRLEAEHGARPGHTHRGALVWKRDPAAQQEIADRVAHLREIGYSAVLLPPEYVLERLREPIVLPSGVRHVGFFPDDGYTIGAEFVDGLLELATGLGLRVIADDAVTGLRRDADGRWEARLAAGGTFAADVVVSAAGAATGEILGLAGAAPVPLVSATETDSPVPGLVAHTEPLRAPLRRVVIGDEVMIRPSTADGVALHVYEEDLTITGPGGEAGAAAAADRVLERARQYLVEGPELRLASFGIGYRPLPADYLPVAGWAGGVKGLYVVVSHSGMTLGPLLGELVSRELTTGEEEPSLRTFRPSRFAA